MDELTRKILPANIGATAVEYEETETIIKQFVKHGELINT